MLCEGSSMRSINRVADVSINTVYNCRPSVPPGSMTRLARGCDQARPVRGDARWRRPFRGSRRRFTMPVPTRSWSRTGPAWSHVVKRRPLDVPPFRAEKRRCHKLNWPTHRETRDRSQIRLRTASPAAYMTLADHRARPVLCNSCVIRRRKPENGMDGSGSGGMAYKVEFLGGTAF